MHLNQLKKYLKVIKTISQKNNGQSLMEYAVILFFLILAVIVALTLFGNQVLALWQNFVNAF